MEFEKLVNERYSVRNFKEVPVESDKIMKILETGRIAPTASNKQPQRLLVLTKPEDLGKIDQVTRCRFGSRLVIVVCSDINECWERSFDQEKSWQVDASIITDHMMLQAQDLGLGTLWVMHFDAQKTSSLFDLDENIIPVSLLVIGYAADDCGPSEKHSQRNVLSHTVLNYSELLKDL